MNHRNPFSSVTLVTRHSIGRFLERRGFLPIVLALVLFTFAPRLQAVDPPPDRGYPNGNTAEGTNALSNLTTGFGNASFVGAIRQPGYETPVTIMWISPHSTPVTNTNS